MTKGDDPHAVRWAISYSERRKEATFTKWHWTLDAHTTLCGRVIPIMNVENYPMYPETDERVEKVDCLVCKISPQAPGPLRFPTLYNQDKQPPEAPMKEFHLLNTTNSQGMFKCWMSPLDMENKKWPKQF